MLYNVILHLGHAFLLPTTFMIHVFYLVEKFVTKHKTVAAIDFGTSYSGYAFSSQENPLEVVTGKWNSTKTNSSELLESLKTPTSLLFKSNGLVEAFGYDAEQKFKALVEENKHHDYRYFYQIKRELLRKRVCMIFF